MTPEIFIAVAGFVLAVFGGVFAVARFVDGKIVGVDKALQDHKLHVAETYATKEGMAHMEQSLTVVIHDVGDRIDKRLDKMTERLDRVIDHDHAPRKAER